MDHVGMRAVVVAKGKALVVERSLGNGIGARSARGIAAAICVGVHLYLARSVKTAVRKEGDDTDVTTHIVGSEQEVPIRVHTEKGGVFSTAINLLQKLQRTIFTHGVGRD